MKTKLNLILILFVLFCQLIYGQIEQIETKMKTAVIENLLINETSERTPLLKILDAETNIPVQEAVDVESILEAFDKKPKQSEYIPKGYAFGYDNSIKADGEAKAAPANDWICNAFNLPLNGSCLVNNTVVQAGSDYFGGCIPNGSPSVFYTFSPTGTNNMITITMSNFNNYGRQLYFMLLKGSCLSPVLVSAYCTFTPSSSSGTVQQIFYNLEAGVTYYVMIASQPGVGNQFNYDICGLQGIAPPLITGPEQDCAGAIPVCDYIYIQENAYTGVGNVSNLIPNTTCLIGGESNSVWYVFTPQTSGDLAFTIYTTNDYDWALYNLTAIGGCQNVPGATPVLCNYSGTNGNTGTTLPVNPTIPRSVNHLGSPFMPGIPVNAGVTYALLVNNYTADANGYTLEFNISPGTASIADNPPLTGAYPELTSASQSCTNNIILVNLSENVNCLSIGQGGFLLTNTTTSTDFTSAMIAFAGGNCSSSELTNSLVISHNGSLTTGTYRLEVTSSNTIVDKCGNPIQPGGFVEFNYLAPLSITADKTIICGGETVTLDADGADGIVTYSLNPGGLINSTNGIFPNLSPSITTTYTVSASYGGCTKTANITITVEGNIIVSVNPSSKSVCDFSSPVNINASTTINGELCNNCIYSWSTGANTQSINVSEPGTYTVSVVTSNGCAAYNTATSNIYLAGAGSGGSSCDVIYVSPDGGGDGFSKESPTTLADAVEKARCTNTIIKMMVGIYNLNDFQIVPSYITIEGGYSSDFSTKSSDLSGGTNSTTIRRQPGADTGYSDDCTAFRIEDGAENFTLQNLRIEMPGSTYIDLNEAGSNLTNYAIKIGSGCSDYNIIRCYIDAGKGAPPAP